MKFFNKSNRDKKIYDLKQVENYLDKVEGIKRDFQASNNVFQYNTI